MQMTPRGAGAGELLRAAHRLPVDKSRVIAIEFKSADPELAAQVANAIAEGYLGAAAGRQAGPDPLASQWLGGEIETLRSAGRRGRGQGRGSTAPSPTCSSAPTTPRCRTSRWATQRAARARARAEGGCRGQGAADPQRCAGGQPIESSDILNSELIRRLSEQRVTLRAQLAEQSSTLLDGHIRASRS